MGGREGGSAESDVKNDIVCSAESGMKNSIVCSDDIRRKSGNKFHAEISMRYRSGRSTENRAENSRRYHLLDTLRGISFVNMVAYHAVWDLVYLYGFRWGWYKSNVGFVWQQYICWSFILLSGFCQPLGHKSLRRALQVFGSGALVTAVTVLFLPDERILFGVLTFLGSAMLLLILFQSCLKECRKRLSRAGMSAAGNRPAVGLVCSVVLFVLTRNVNEGSLGFAGWNWQKLPAAWYRNLGTAYLGFPPGSFYSADYFSLLPWFFLFLCGLFLYYLLEKRKKLEFLKRGGCRPLEWIGRHTLILYLLHQPVIWILLQLLLG